MLKVFPRVTNQPLADSFPFLLLFGSFTFVIVLNSLKLKAFKPGLLFGIFRVLHTVRSLIFKVRAFLSESQRRRRDLNPRAATNDLLPFQGSPFSHLGTSAYTNA